MRKTVAFLICFLTLLWLSLLVLHPTLQQVTLWLSPSLGAELYIFAAVFYLLAANPFTYISIGLSWLAIAFIGGLIVRRRLGASLTILLVWLMLVPVLTVSLFGLAMNVQGIVDERQGRGILSAIPPIPPGLTITRLLEIPIVGEKAAQLMKEGFEDLNQEQVMEMLRETAYNLGTSMLLRPLIIVAGTLLGVEAGRILETRGGGLLPRILSRGGQGVFAVIVLLVALGARPSGAQIIDTGDGIYTENILGLADHQGRVMVLDAFVATAGARVGHRNLVAQLLVSHRLNLDPIVSALSIPEDFDAGSLVNLVPGALLFSVYVDTTPREALGITAESSGALAEAYGLEVLSLGALTVPEMEFNGTALPSITVALGYSDTSLEELASILLAEFNSRGGLAQAISEALSRGALVPGASEDVPDTTVVVVGYVNLGPLIERISIPAHPADLDEPLNMVKEESIEVALGAHIWDMGVKPIGGGYLLDILELLDQQSISFSPSSDLSFITLVTPNNNESWELTPNVAVCTDQPEDSYLLSLYVHLLKGLGMIEITHTANPSAEALRVQTQLSLPPRVVLERTLGGPSASRTITVTLTATNQGTEMVQNLKLSDTGLISTYGQSVVVEGETEKSQANLEPGQSTSITYSVKTGPPGVYTLRPAKASYSFADKTYQSVSKRHILNTGPPSVFAAAETIRKDATMLLDIPTNGAGSVAMDMLLVGAGLLILLNLTLSIRRMVRLRNLSVGAEN